MATDDLGTQCVESTARPCRRRVVQTMLAVGAGGIWIPGSGAASQPLQSGDDDRTWVRVELTGRTAEGGDFGGDSESQVAATVADELPETAARDLIARQESDSRTVEVVDPEVSVDQFRAALDASGYAYDEIGEGVTQQTRDEAIGVSSEKSEDIGDLIGDRGVVRIDIYHRTDGEYVTADGALTRTDFQSVGSATQGDRLGPHVPVRVRPSAAKRFQQQLVDTGVAQDGGSQCTYDQDPENTEPCLLLVDDSEVVTAFGMAPGLADSMRNGEWAEDSSFVLTTSSYAEAQSVAVNLRSGPLPAPVDLSTSDELPVDESTLEDRGIETDTADESSGSADGGSTNLETPGFGIGAAIAGVGAAGALLRRLGDADR